MGSASSPATTPFRSLRKNLSQIRIIFVFLDERVRAVDDDDASVVHDRNAVADRLRFFHGMCREEHAAARLFHCLDSVPQLAS